MTMMSVTAALETPGNAASRASLARSDWGLLVGLPSVVSAPPSSAPITMIATTIATTHAHTVRQGWLALDSATLLSQAMFIFPPVRSKAPIGRVRPCGHGRSALNRVEPIEGSTRLQVPNQVGPRGVIGELEDSRLELQVRPTPVQRRISLPGLLCAGVAAHSFHLH